jgi:hypothetical protein
MSARFNRHMVVARRGPTPIRIAFHFLLSFRFPSSFRFLSETAVLFLPKINYRPLYMPWFCEAVGWPKDVSCV